MRFVSISLLLVTISNPCYLQSQDIFDAVRKGDTDRVQYLYKLKPDTLKAKNESGFTPLIIAIYRNQKEVAEYLLEHGAGVNENSPEGPALMAAVYKNNTELTRLLIKYKALPNLQNEEGVTALMFAAMNNNLEIVSLLLSHGADKTLLSKSGHTALTYAQMYEYKEVIIALSK